MNPLPIVVNGPQMQKPYIEPLVAWLTDFTIDVGGGEMVKVWDPTAPTRLVDEALKRGFTFPNDAETIKTSFGYGSWQYNPDAATKLLKKAGLTQNADQTWIFTVNRSRLPFIPTAPLAAGHTKTLLPHKLSGSGLDWTHGLRWVTPVNSDPPWANLMSPGPRRTAATTWKTLTSSGRSQPSTPLTLSLT